MSKNRPTEGICPGCGRDTEFAPLDTYRAFCIFCHEIVLKIGGVLVKDSDLP